MTKKRIIWLLAAGLVFAVLTFATFAVVSSLRTAFAAESNLHAVLNTISACRTYIIDNDGRWPSSWNDIDPLMPDDRDWNVHEVVVVDFSADPSVLARQDSSSFSGITVNDPVYSHRYEIDALLETLREFHRKDADGG